MLNVMSVRVDLAGVTADLESALMYEMLTRPTGRHFRLVWDQQGGGPLLPPHTTTGDSAVSPL